jgi:regulator of RNase E activity RraA
MKDGEILVLDAMGVTQRAAIGDMMYSRVQTGGAIGVVVDGAVRDVPFAAQRNFPLFARSSAVDSFFSWLRPWEADMPIQCGGVLVVPGDWLIADSEGIVVVPAAHAEALAETAELKRISDAFSQALLFDGFGLDDAYPLPQHMKSFLKEFSSTGCLPTRAAVAAVRPKGIK